MPKAAIGAKLKKGESCFHQVIILTTIDDAVEVAWKHDGHGNV